jgi:hypothetical protein
MSVATSEFFSTWAKAREFVQNTISQNPRLDDGTKTKLLQVELQGYTEYSGQYFASEKTELSEYYQYLQREFPKYTQDSRFLGVFDIAVEGAKETADPSIVTDREQSEPVKVPTWIYGALALGIVYVFTRK